MSNFHKFGLPGAGGGSKKDDPKAELENRRRLKELSKAVNDLLGKPKADRDEHIKTLKSQVEQMLARMGPVADQAGERLQDLKKALDALETLSDALEEQ